MFHCKYTLSALLLALPVDLFAQATAPTGAPAQPGFLDSLLAMLPMFIIVFFIFYFLVLKPQERRVKEHERLISELKKGDEILTSSGFLGRVAGVEEEYILVELANNVRVRLGKSFVSRKIEKESTKTAAKNKAS